MKIATLLKHYNTKKQHRQDVADQHSRELADKVADIEQSHHCNITRVPEDDPELIALRKFANYSPVVPYRHRQLSQLPRDERRDLERNVVYLREQGFSQHEIAAVLEINRHNLEKTFLDLGIRGRRPNRPKRPTPATDPNKIDRLVAEIVAANKDW